MSRWTIAGRYALTGAAIEVEIDAGVVTRVDVIDEVRDNIWLAPGFVDLQVNGYGGFDFNDNAMDEQTVVEATQRLLAVGTSVFLPTLITAAEEDLRRRLAILASACRRFPQLARAIAGVHLEGPHLCAEDGARGAHPVEHVRAPELAEFERCQQAAEGLIRMVTVSPHWPEAPQFIRELVARGVLVALGHTHATQDEIAAVVDAGATLSTHLGNGIATLLPRHPNPLWSQLAEDRLQATFIADGHHLPAETLKVMLRAKGIERSILVSDSVALAGMQPGEYETPIGGNVVLQEDGRLRVAGSNMLAGASRSLKDDVAWALRSRLCTLAEAVTMAAVNPGRVLGLHDGIEVGASVNLIQLRVARDGSELELLSAAMGETIWNDNAA